MKRLLSLLLAFLILVSVASVTHFSALVNQKGDGFYYQILNGKYAEITGIVDIGDCDWVINIPEEIDGYKVTSIGSRIFGDCEDLCVNEIVIPNTVTHIGEKAFYLTIFQELGYSGSDITKINIPSGVVYIGDRAFENCTKLKKLTIPESVVHIGEKAFKNCNSLKSVIIPGTVRYLGDEAFADCNKLETVTINKGVNKLNNKVFYNCRNLSKVSLPENLKYIEDYVFYNCPKLKEIKIYDQTKIYGELPFGYYKEKGKDKKVQGFITKCLESEDRTSGGNMTSGVLASHRYIYNTVYYLNPEYNQRLINSAGSVDKIKIRGKTVKKWSSSKKSVATITNKGKLTALRNGKTTLKAKLSDGTTVTRVLRVEDKPELNYEKITVKVGQKKKVTISSKANGVDNVYKSTSKAKIIGSVKNECFYVKGVRKGETTLKITVNGMKIKLKVSVK